MADDVLDALMDDEIPVKKLSKGETKTTGASKIRTESTRRLTEVELSVLRALRDTKKVRLICRMTGYPEVVVTKAIERLIEKGYIDENLNVLREPEVKAERRRSQRKSGKLLLIDIAIAIMVLILVIGIAYYFFT